MEKRIVDASWERVESFAPPSVEEGWELVEESAELVVLDLTQAQAAAVGETHAHAEPGSTVVLTVCAPLSLTVGS